MKLHSFYMHTMTIKGLESKFQTDYLRFFLFGHTNVNE